MTPVILGLAAAAPAAAQIGHLPEDSPYRDLRVRQTLTFMSGYLSGGRGTAPVGPSGGPLGGVRWDIAIGAPTTGFVGLALANLERNLVNPDLPPDTRFLGTARQSVFLIDAGASLHFTGRKTWHGLAPYAGAAFGLAIGDAVPEDTLSGFSFKTKFHVGPHAGVRWFPTRRFHFRLEGRNILWRLSFPLERFSTPPVNAPADWEPLLDPSTHRGTEWTHHLTLILAVGYSIRF